MCLSILYNISSFSQKIFNWSSSLSLFTVSKAFSKAKSSIALFNPSAFACKSSSILAVFTL